VESAHGELPVATAYSTAEVACYGGRSARSDRLTFSSGSQISTTAHASFNVLDFSELSNQ